jgi:uncharacterized protein (TIGR02001 family)
MASDQTWLTGEKTMKFRTVILATVGTSIAAPAAAEVSRFTQPGFNVDQAMLHADEAAAQENLQVSGDHRSLEETLAHLADLTDEALDAGPARARSFAVQDAGEGGGAGETSGPVSISFDLALFSDYRFRGVSLSDKDPAFQPSITLEHKAGLYVSAWGSNIARFADTNIELDLTAGWSGAVGGAELSAGVVGYLYPGGKGGNYLETFGSLGTTLGPVEMKLGAAYAPSQKNIGDDNFYVYGALSSGIPGTPVTINAQVGHEDGSLAGPTGKKWDWSLGAQYVLKKMTIGVSYVDSDVKRSLDTDKIAQSAVVASISFSF